MNLLIVNFHYFRESTYKSGIYPVSQTQLVTQLRLIGNQYDFISASTLADCFSNQQFLTGNHCLVTFDDGLKEQMSAFELLTSLKIPAVYYIPVKPIVENSVLDVHKLQLIRTKMGDKEILQEMRLTQNYSFSSEDAVKASTQYMYDDETARELKFQLNFKMSRRQKKVFLDKTFIGLFGDEKEYARLFYMNESDLAQLGRYNQLGAHGYEHEPLALIGNSLEDMCKSINYLDKIIGQKIRSISYPYGSKEAVNQIVADEAKSLGMDFGLTMWRGINEIDTSINPYLLFRVDTNDAPGGKNPMNFE